MEDDSYNPTTLEQALETDNDRALFCLYGRGGPTTVKAAEAKEMMETGNWFRSPVDALEAFAELEGAAKEDKRQVLKPPDPTEKEGIGIVKRLREIANNVRSKG